MKSSNILFLVLIISCLFTKQIKAQDIKTEKTNLIKSEFVTAEFSITGMACQEGCANAIQKNIENLQGVKKAEVSYEKGFGIVLFDNTFASIEDITQIIEATKVKNYTYNVKTTTIIKD